MNDNNFTLGFACTSNHDECHDVDRIKWSQILQSIYGPVIGPRFSLLNANGRPGSQTDHTP